MIIDLFQLPETENAFEAEIASDDLNLEEEAARIVGGVRIAGKLRKGIAQTDANGRIAGEFEIDCTRCLAPVRTKLDFPFKVVYVTAENYTQAAEAELRSDDMDVAVFDGGRIDLTELAREQILLNLPARFLCREDCRGLCPVCGADRNTVDCNCEEKEIDPRWSALKNLK